MQCFPKNVIKGENVVGCSQKIILLLNYDMDECTLDVTCNTPDVICLYYDQRWRPSLPHWVRCPERRLRGPDRSSKLLLVIIILLPLVPIFGCQIIHLREAPSKDGIWPNSFSTPLPSSKRTLCGSYFLPILTLDLDILTLTIVQHDSLIDGILMEIIVYIGRILVEYLLKNSTFSTPPRPYG